LGIFFGIAGAILSGNGNNSEEVSSAIPIVFGVLGCCFSLVMFVLSVMTGLITTAAYGNFAAKGNLTAALRFGEVFGLLKAAPGAYVLALLGIAVASIVAQVGTIAFFICFIVIFLPTAYSMVVMAHLWGQAYNQARNAMTTGTVVITAPSAPPSV
jgi:hypothetical protein